MRTYVTATLFCVTALAAAAQDHLATLGISEGRAKEAVFDSFVSDAISVAGRPAAFLAMSPEARVSLVNFTLNLARTFVESDDFKRRYADHREANGPDPLPEEQTADQIFAKQRAGFENQVAEMRKLFDQITPEQRARTTFPVDDIEWRKWNNIHRYARQGVSFKEMSDDQRTRAFALLGAGSGE